MHCDIGTLRVANYVIRKIEDPPARQITIARHAPSSSREQLFKDAIERFSELNGGERP
jgi:hypothetical protein